MKDLLDKVESLRKERVLSNDVARLVSFILTVNGQDVLDAWKITEELESYWLTLPGVEDTLQANEPSQAILALDEMIFDRLHAYRDRKGQQAAERIVVCRIALWDLTLPSMADWACLLNRRVCQGADPLSVMLATGCFKEFEAEIRQAHTQGPGALTGRALDVWLFLAACSADEAHASEVSVVDRGKHFVECVKKVIRGSEDAEFFTQEVERMRKEILALPFQVEEVGGRSMPVYVSDLGFAAAYWRGEPCGAIRATDCVMVGCQAPHTLESLGIKLSKVLSPSFGIL